MSCRAASIVSATTDCSPTPTVSVISQPFESCCTNRYLRRPQSRALTVPLTVSGLPLCAGIAAPRCSSSRPSRERNTSGGRRSAHEHPALNVRVLLVGASSNRADANACCRDLAGPSFLQASRAPIRLRPQRSYSPHRRGLRIGSTIQLAGPGASVQIPIAHRHC